jgi:hypothetical protein
MNCTERWQNPHAPSKINIGGSDAEVFGSIAINAIVAHEDRYPPANPLSALREAGQESGVSGLLAITRFSDSYPATPDSLWYGDISPTNSGLMKR